MLLKHSLLFPVTFICVIWIIFILKEYTNTDLTHFGIYPLSLKGLKGILFSPLIHNNYSHLISNTIPLFILSWGVFYFYRSLGYKIFLLSYIFSGIWIWFGARDGWHIGASGLIYSYAAFVFTSGVIRKNKELLAIALVIVFLYGDLVWGMFPLTTNTNISFEGHYLGAIAGFILAVYYRKDGPQRYVPDWDNENDTIENEEENIYND